MRTSFAPIAWIIASLMLSAPVTAQLPDANVLADSIQSEVIAASVRGDDDRLQAARALAERTVLAYPDDALLHHYYGYALYRIAARAHDGEDVDAMLVTAEEALTRSAQLEPLPETHALIASVYGLMIGRDPSRGPSLGHKAGDQRAIADRLGRDNPRVWLQKGIGAIYRPPAFGGGLERADEFLERAAELFRSDAPEPPLPRWGRADVHVWRGQVLHRLGELDRASAAYDQALEMEPEYAWVKQVLVPALQSGDALPDLD
jgi:tetratricopeptide (TPR) repeat protein